MLIGGSADLAGSNNTTVPNAGEIGQGDDPFAGGTVHFGVREHAMAAITNGIALDGTFLSYAGTFLVFSDYMRPSLRLAALMRARSTYVFTHDSIFVGEDGPTHQPVEQLEALRAIPGLTVIRPADAIESALAWVWIVTQARGPVALVLTRQTVPALKREGGLSLDAVQRGAYAVREPAGEPDVVLLASAREVCSRGRRCSSDEIAARGRAEPRAARGAARGLPRRAAAERHTRGGRRGRARAELALAGRARRPRLRHRGLRRLGALSEARRALRLHARRARRARASAPA
jgi:transketolase